MCLNIFQSASSTQLSTSFTLLQYRRVFGKFSQTHNCNTLIRTLSLRGNLDYFLNLKNEGREKDGGQNKE